MHPIRVGTDFYYEFAVLDGDTNDRRKHGSRQYQAATIQYDLD